MLYIPKKDRTEGILQGVIDIHCHSGPCVIGKDFDEIELATMMRNTGYRGVLFKQHLLGANRIDFVRQAVPGIEVFGGITLNHYTGGLNPFAVASCVIFGGKEVKFPNMHAQHHIEVFGSPTYDFITASAGAAMEADLAKTVKGIVVSGENGDLLPEVHTILQMIAEADIGVETGHLSPAESLALIRAARQAGVKKIWHTHANWWRLYQYSPQAVTDIADEGAFIEVSARFAIPYLATDTSNEGVEYTARIIKAVGAHRCIMSTDYGTEGRYNPIEAMRVFIRAMMREGVSREDIDIMTKENPARVLGL